MDTGIPDDTVTLAGQKTRNRKEILVAPGGCGNDGPLTSEECLNAVVVGRGTRELEKVVTTRESPTNHL